MKVIGQIKPILLYFLISLSTLTETIYSAALPEIAEALKTEGGVAQLSTTAYYIGFAFGIFTLGRVSDIYGRRPVVLFGISFYIISTFLISLSTNIEFFIMMRVFQAYGASVGSVIAQSMARDSYKGWELSYIYASVSMIMSIVPSIGSAIGGYIVEYYGHWKYVFRFLMLFSAALLLVYIKFLPETNPNIGAGRNNRFYYVLKTALKDKVLLSFAFMVGAYNGVCFGFYIQAPFIFINKLGMAPSDYGKLFLILSVANLLGGLICRYLIKKFVNIYKIKAIGLIFSSIGCIGLLIGAYLIKPGVSLTFATLMVFIPMAIHLMGHTLVVPMLLRNALEGYVKVTGAAGSIFGALYYVITAAVSFLISSFHSDTINNYAYIYAILLLICIVLYYFISKWKENEFKTSFR
ncbi:MAG: Bcr/CflA family efflux MFS transporter [Rickettsiaceae bacterium]|nr:Bcr/CflA family efflux MFS transporter [Rickettsiaceae bacterium]